MKLLFLVLLLAAGVSRAEVAVNVIFKPLPPEFERLEPTIRAHIVAASQAWTSHFKTVDCTIDVQFNLQPWPLRGTAHSVCSAPYEGETKDGKPVLEDGAAQKIRTGHDANGADPDIEMFFDPAYFRTLWFDPDPVRRTALMPPASACKTDAFTVILHELGHAYGINGYIDPKGGHPGDAFSVFDRWVTFDGRNFFFHGPNAMKACYGRPVLLAHTNNNYQHVGEVRQTTDPKLVDDLMNGITFQYSRRYYVSPLDIAILADCGLMPVK